MGTVRLIDEDEDVGRPVALGEVRYGSGAFVLAPARALSRQIPVVPAAFRLPGEGEPGAVLLDHAEDDAPPAVAQQPLHLRSGLRRLDVGLAELQRP